MQIITARASARYKGRIEAELSLGDVVILIRDYDSGGDGSCLLFDLNKGIPPRNWMPAGSEMQKTDYGFLFTHKRGETLEIFIETIYFEEKTASSLETSILKLGAEQEFSDLLSQNINLLGSELVLEGREIRTAAGPMDILLRDKKDNPVVVEVKRRRATLSDIYQLRRYLHTFKGKSRGILVAPVLAKNAKPHIDEDPALSFIRISYEDLRKDK